MKHDQKMLLVFLVITTPFFSNRCGTDLEGSRFTKSSLKFHWNDLFLSFGVGTERQNIYLGIWMPFTFVAFFLEDKKRCPFTPKTFVPQHWSGFLDMCFFEVKILFCSGFFVKEKDKQNNDFQKQVWGVPILEITSFEGFKQTVSFIQFGGMKRRNTGVNIWIVLTLAIEMHSRGKHHNLSATGMHLFDLPHHSSLRKWHRYPNRIIRNYVWLLPCRYDTMKPGKVKTEMMRCDRRGF